MFNYKIKFAKKSDVDKIDDDVVFDMIEDYFNTLYNNGQVIGGFDVFSHNGEIFLTVVLPMEDSLSDKYSNGYVKERLEKLESVFDIEVIKEGDNLEYYKSCTCEKPSWYYLYSSFFQEEGSLVCGDCNRPVPLYKVPYILREKEHNSLTNWQSAYMSMHNLWMYGHWNKFTYGQFCLHNSKLNREGRRIRKELEKILRMPVYYYLYYFDLGEAVAYMRGTPEVCPKCGGEWARDGEFCKCEKCRLLADDPEWKGRKSEKDN